MKEFIHTFSAKVHLFTKEKNALTRAFNDKIFYDSKDKVFVLYKYAENGLRIHIEFNSTAEKKYDKEHKAYKAELIVTPAKLIYPNGKMKKLYTAEEYTLAMEKLKEILQEIKDQSGIDLWNETKLKRIDLTKDIETESDAYTMEVIRLSKLALHKTGYHLWVPTKEEVERTGWSVADSIMFYNHNQEVQAKIYNKLKDFKNIVDVSDVKGLLRFELSLKRNFLKNSGLIQKGNTPFEILSEVCSFVLNGAEELMQTHIVGPLWSGNFLSRKLQKKYIKRHCKTKESKMEKMLKYRDECRDGILVTGGKVLDYFEEIELSPLCTSKEFPYIPSFARLMSGEENEKVKGFVERFL
jgi:hypothetical protein